MISIFHKSAMFPATALLNIVIFDYQSQDEQVEAGMNIRDEYKRSELTLNYYLRSCF